MEGVVVNLILRLFPNFLLLSVDSMFKETFFLPKEFHVIASC